MPSNLDKRLNALEAFAGGPELHFVYYEHEDRFVLPGGIVTDADTFAQAVEKSGRRAIVIKVGYVDLKVIRG